MQYPQTPQATPVPAMPTLESESRAQALPDGFVYLDEALDGIDWDAKYAASDNFTGAPVDGYEANRVALSRAMVGPLARARDLAAEAGYGLLVWDAARPQRAVDAFVRWANEPEDGLTKGAHHPNVARSELFSQGYIARRSGHSRGAAIDLTLTDAATGEPLDMGTDFDYMDPKSHHGAKGLTDAQRHNRAALASIMREAGFKRYDAEWWHYSLTNDPHPGEYFDFVIANH